MNRDLLWSSVAGAATGVIARAPIVRAELVEARVPHRISSRNHRDLLWFCRVANTSVVNARAKNAKNMDIYGHSPGEAGRDPSWPEEMTANKNRFPTVIHRHSPSFDGRQQQAW